MSSDDVALRLDRIAEAPGRATAADVTWLLDGLKRTLKALKRLCGDDFWPHESRDKCIHCGERFATEDDYPFCALCLARYQRDYACDEVARLTDELKERDGRIAVLEQQVSRERHNVAAMTERAIR